MASTQSNMHLLVLNLAHSRYLRKIYWPEPHALFSDFQFPYPQWPEELLHNRKCPTDKYVCSNLPKRNHDHDTMIIIPATGWGEPDSCGTKGWEQTAFPLPYSHRNVIFLLWSQIPSLVRWKHPARNKQAKTLLYDSIYINVWSRQATNWK